MVSGEMPRPAGALNGEAVNPLAPVKKWSHRHEMIVYYHVVHMMNGNQIAEIVNLSPGRVSQILNDPYAVKRIKEVRDKIRVSILENVDLRLTRLGDQALQNLEHTLNRKDLDLVLHTDQKKHQDNLSFNVLTKLGMIGKEDGDKDKDSGNKELTAPLMKKVLYALEKSNEADEIRRGERQSRVVEAEIETDGSEKNETEAEADVLNPAGRSPGEDHAEDHAIEFYEFPDG